MSETQTLSFAGLFAENQTPGRVPTIIVVSTWERKALFKAAFGHSSKTQIITPGSFLGGFAAELVLVEEAVLDNPANSRWFDDNVRTRLVPGSLGIHPL